MYSRSRWLAVALLSVACNHTEPFRADPDTPNGPLGGGVPLRLTYNIGIDWTPSWEPDALRFLYSFEQTDHPELDVCIGELNATGGSRLLSLCQQDADERDTLDTRDWPALSPTGRLAYLRSSQSLDQTGPISRSIVVATLNPSDTGRVVRTFSYLSSTGRSHAIATHLQWLNSHELVYIGALIQNVSPVPPPVIVISGLDIVRLDVDDPTPTPIVIPGTDYASSVAVAEDGASIYYTLGGDSRVFQQILGSGAVNLTHDFGLLGIARDVSVHDSSLVAVVGGRVTFFADPFSGQIQQDNGGALLHVDLRTGVETNIGVPQHIMRHPSLSPDGVRIVTEVYDSLQPAKSDLWLVETP